MTRKQNMYKMKKFLIYFVIASFKSCCFAQTGEHHETGITGSSDNTSQEEESAVSSKGPEVLTTFAVDATFNPCLYDKHDVEHFEEEDDETMKRFTNHFLNCTHIGIEPGTFEFFPNGSLHIPQLSMVLDRSDFCQKDINGVVFICDERIQSNITDDEAQKTKQNPYDYLSDEFLNCSGHIAIKPGAFETRANRSVYVPLYDRVFDYSNYLIREDGRLYLCPVFFPREEKFPESFEIVTVVGLSVSILFIAAYIICFMLLPSLRNLPGYCLFCLCFSLKTAYICFLVRSIGLSLQECEDLVISVMYFFLTSFFWMNVLSFDVWRSLKMATSKLRRSSESMLWKRFAFYSAYAWLFPLCIVMVAVMFTKYGSSMDFLILEFHPELCWFAKKGALFVYLALPLIILMCLNVIFFSTSFIMIIRASMNTTDSMATFWNRFFLFLRLAVIMGVAWIFGIIAAATNKPVLFYIFVILNTLQGVFIFCSFVLNEKTRKEWNKKIRKRKTSCGRTQITSQQVQSMTSV